MIIDIPVLETISDLQIQHGLNYENYRRYRSYCSRKVHRLRHSLNVHQKIPSSAKARHQRGRKLMDISNAMVVEAGSKSDEYAERMLIIPLFLSERAWSYAMQLKQEVVDQPRRKYHLLRRIKKAAEHAQRFKKLCHEAECPSSDRTKLEATAYAAYIDGVNQVEHENWLSAKDQLREALTSYFKLCLLVEKDDVLEHYRRRVDELRSSLRYCAFNLNEMTSKKTFKTTLPPTLQFNDIVFCHLQKMNRQPVEEVKPEVGSEELEDDDEYAEPDVDDNEPEMKDAKDQAEEEHDNEEDDGASEEPAQTGGALSYFKRFLRG